MLDTFACGGAGRSAERRLPCRTMSWGMGMDRAHSGSQGVSRPLSLVELCVDLSLVVFSLAGVGRMLAFVRKALAPYGSMLAFVSGEVRFVRGERSCVSGSFTPVDEDRPVACFQVTFACFAFKLPNGRFSLFERLLPLVAVGGSAGEPVTLQDRFGVPGFEVDVTLVGCGIAIVYGDTLL
jgi:hypothetical protein